MTPTATLIKQYIGGRTMQADRLKSSMPQRMLKRLRSRARHGDVTAQKFLAALKEMRTPHAVTPAPDAPLKAHATEGPPPDWIKDKLTPQPEPRAQTPFRLKLSGIKPDADIQ